MEYKIGNIIFSKDTQYDKVLYWKLYIIYLSCDSILYRRIIDDSTDYNELIKYKNSDLNIKNSSEIIRKIPYNILKKIKDIKLFELGYIEQSAYNEIEDFKNELRVWLKHPNGTNYNIEFSDYSEEWAQLGNYCDNFCKIDIKDNNMILNSYSVKGILNIQFTNCIVVLDGIQISINEFKSKMNKNWDATFFDYEFEIYDYDAIKYNDKYEFWLKIRNNMEYSTVIITADDVIHY